ncbi:MAG: hypothetical protein Q9183_004840, partial [Haloplaca sp. 2 TL-2023]
MAVTTITPSDVAYQKAHKDDDRRKDLYITACLMIILPTVAVAVRFACRRHLKAAIAADDIAILLALVRNTLHCAYYGTGRHTLTNPMPDVQHFIKIMYSIELTYTILITTTKLSILLFYRRVFMNQATSRRFRYTWYAILTWTICWCISVFFAAAFQCTPASYFWTKYTRKTEGTCMDLNPLLIVTACLNIITDIALLILPMPVVWNLQIDRSQKLAVSCIFLLGG